MLALAPSYTHRELFWEDFLNLFKKKNFSMQFDEDDNHYLVYGYDGPEVICTRIYKSEIPQTLPITQEQNDLYKTSFETIYKSKCSSDISLLFVFLWILGDTLAIITSILINNYFLSYISLSHTVLDFILLLFVTFYRQINVEEYLPIINTISSDDVRFSGNFGRRRLSKFNYFYYSKRFY